MQQQFWIISTTVSLKFMNSHSEGWDRTNRPRHQVGVFSDQSKKTTILLNSSAHSPEFVEQYGRYLP